MNTWTSNGGSALSGSVTTSDLMTPQRLCGVPSAVAGVEASLQGLQQSIGRLSERLEKAGVLTAVPPQAAPGSSQPTPPAFMTSLANAIDRQRVQANTLNMAVNELIERIDL